MSDAVPVVADDGEEDLEVIAAMLEEASTIPPGSTLVVLLSSPVSSMDFGEGSDASSVGLDVCPPSSPQLASPITCISPAPCLGSMVVSSRAAPAASGGPLPDSSAPRLPRAKGRQRSASSPATSARKSTRIGSASKLAGASPNAVEKALRRAVARNLDPGPSTHPAVSSNFDVVCDDAYSALAGVPLGHIAKIMADSAIVFRGEKGPAIE